MLDPLYTSYKLHPSLSYNADVLIKITVQNFAEARFNAKRTMECIQQIIKNEPEVFLDATTREDRCFGLTERLRLLQFFRLEDSDMDSQSDDDD